MHSWLNHIPRVPSKSLLRLKAVSRSWNELMQNQQFISDHHKFRAAISSNGCILIKRAGRHRRDKVFSFIYSQSPTSIRVEDSPQFKDKYRYTTISPPCNGIFCVFFDNYSVVLWNPALRQVKALPQYPKALGIPPPNFTSSGRHNIGLSFDSKSNAYKVVRIWVFHRDTYRRHEKLTHTEEYHNIVVVWEPGTNDWRQIDNVPPIPIGYTWNGQLNLKGKCYWRSGDLESEVMISFDMLLEVFRVIPLPDPRSVAIRKGLAYWDSIAVLNESIALISLPLQHNENCFEVWLMRENSSATDDVSWSKHITVEKPQPKMAPLGFWKNGELILHKEHAELVFLNTSTGETVDTDIHVNNLQNVHVYDESLVSVSEWI